MCAAGHMVVSLGNLALESYTFIIVSFSQCASFYNEVYIFVK